jgi:hypothetical protein
MKKLPKISATVILTFVLTAFAFGGQTETPPCPSPELGQTETPPCAATLADMGTATGFSTTSGNLRTSMVAQETSFSQIAANVLLNLLPLF